MIESEKRLTLADISQLIKFGITQGATFSILMKLAFVLYNKKLLGGFLNDYSVFVVENSGPTKIVFKRRYKIIVYTKRVRTTLDQADNFIAFFEEVLTDVLIAILSFENELPENTDIIAFKSCLLKTIFLRGVPLDKIEDKSRSRTAYIWHENSCYLDALLTVIMDCDSDFWRTTIFDAKKTTSEMKEFQKEFLIDYDRLERGERVFCTNVRKTLLSALPDLYEKKSKRWRVFNVGRVYDAITDLFPALKIPVFERVRRDDKWVIKKSKLATINMADFLGAQPGDPRALVVEKLDAQGLVFLNGGVPRIKCFDQTGMEKGKTVYGRQSVPFAYKKSRAFGEYILNHRYRLVGVVTLEGVNQAGDGIHYFSYILKGDSYFKYDGASNPSYKKVKVLPRAGVWEEKNGFMPILYFYARV